MSKIKYQRFTPSGCKDIGIRVCVKNTIPSELKKREYKILFLKSKITV